ncbi:MAG: glutathione S-transferase family protein [Burkholderiales bacterium]|nr:glutathione S-transferase family protein [Burkholderiales bacterium]
MIKLYQFAFSHFCEKARWALDYKSIPYTPVNLLPGLHVKPIRKLAPKTCMPLLVDEKTAVQDSAAIITYLDKMHPDPLLTPRDAREAKEALDWEKYFDEEIGVTLRLWFYYHTLPDRGRAMKFIMTGAPWYGPPLFAVIFPKVREAMTKLLRINAESAKDAEERLIAALDRLDDALKDRRFLVGDRFSRPDLAACALLSPLLLPTEKEAVELFPRAVRAFRERHKGRACFTWAKNVYDNYRQPMAATIKAAA